MTLPGASPLWQRPPHHLPLPAQRKGRKACIPLVVAALLGIYPVAATASHDCLLPGRVTPAIPVPECVDDDGHEVACATAGAIRLWPIDFRPASAIPATRDSTDRFAGLTIPGEKSGHELFASVDVVETLGSPRRLYVAYNAGIQAWDLESNPAAPAKLSGRDGWEDHFLSFPHPDEVLSYLLDIAAVNLNPTTDLVGAAAKEPVGTSLWRYNVTSQSLDPLYQDTGTHATQIRVIERTTGNILAFVGTDDGVAIYDVSAADALTTPCLDNQGASCGGIYRGTFGSGTSVFIDVLYRPFSDSVLVSVGGGVFKDLELWEVTDPRDPGTADLRFQDITHSLGNALFEKNGDIFLALVNEENGLQQERLQILYVDACLNGPCSLADGTVEEAVAPFPIAPASTIGTASDFLTYSRIGGTPYLYYGAGTGNLNGPDLEQLWDLSLVAKPNPFPLTNLPEITASGGSYVDPCGGWTNRYWSHYYHKNAHGLNNFNPRIGKFSSDGYFYRAASSVLDVHVLGDGVPIEDPTVVTTVLDPPPYYFEEYITFQATAINCDPSGTGNWTWLAGDTDALGLGPGTNPHDILWTLCANPAPCLEKTFEVWALNSECVDPVVDSVTVTVKDARPSVSGVDLSPPGGTYPVCTQLQLTANTAGRTPLNYSWLITRDGVPVDPGSDPTANPLDWDTFGLQGEFSSIFTDGFESGNLAAWNQPAGGPAQASFDVQVTVNNDTGVPAIANLVINLTPLTDPAFSSPAITATNVGGSSFDLTANTSGASEWKFEIEDPGNGSSAGCEVYTSCVRVDWSSSPLNGHSWQPPNVAGMYRVTAWARNCVTPPGGEVQAEIVVDVDNITTPEPPAMTSFRIHTDSIPPCVNDFFNYTCPVSTSIKFDLQATGDFTDFEVDWEGNGFWLPYPAGTNITHTYSTIGPRSPRARATGHGNISGDISLFGSTFSIVP